MPLIPALGRQRQADFWVRGQPGLQSEFQDSQGYREKPCLEKPNQPTNQPTKVMAPYFLWWTPTWPPSLNWLNLPWTFSSWPCTKDTPGNPHWIHFKLFQTLALTWLITEAGPWQLCSAGHTPLASHCPVHSVVWLMTTRRLSSDARLGLSSPVLSPCRESLRVIKASTVERGSASEVF